MDYKIQVQSQIGNRCAILVSQMTSQIWLSLTNVRKTKKPEGTDNTKAQDKNQMKLKTNLFALR